MNLIRSLFRSDAICCQHCGEPLPHDEVRCAKEQARKMSRRYFFGVTLGAAAAAVVQPQIEQIFSRAYQSRWLINGVDFGRGSESVVSVFWLGPGGVYSLDGGVCYRLCENVTRDELMKVYPA